MGDLLGPVSDNVGWCNCIPPSATGEIYSTSYYYPAAPRMEAFSGYNQPITERHLPHK